MFGKSAFFAKKNLGIRGARVGLLYLLRLGPFPISQISFLFFKQKGG